MQSLTFYRLFRGGSHSFSFTITKSRINVFSSGSLGHENLNSKASLINYLTTVYDFSESRATSISNIIYRIKVPEKPLQNLEFLRECGFSETHIKKSVNVGPTILSVNVDTILKPKIKLLQGLGITGSELGQLVSKNALVLTVSLNKTLIPCITILKKILSDHKDVIKVLTRCRLIFRKTPNNEFLPNLKLLESYGIVGAQLSSLLKSHPYLFVMKESKLRDLVNRVAEMGFSTESRMFAHGLQTISSTKIDTLNRKFELFESYGFPKEDLKMLFIKFPALFRTSEKKLRIGLEFFLKTVKADLSLIISNPVLLMFSIEKRILPRYQVVSFLRLKSLSEKDPSFLHAVMLTEAKFLKKFILNFRGQEDELMAIYRGQQLPSID